MTYFRKFTSFPLWRDKFLRGVNIFSLLVLALLYVITRVKLGNVGHLLIIHFDSFRGIDSLGTPLQARGFLFLGILFFVLQCALTPPLYRRYRLGAYLESFFTAVCLSLLLAGLLVIITVNQL